MLFKYNSLAKESIIESTKLWFYSLMPSMFAMYIFTDLLINYGFGDLTYRFFKNNTAILIGLSMLLGTPANVKYICDFYENGYISKDEATWLLHFAYSPNPLFILAIAPNGRWALAVLAFLYATNFLIAIMTKRNKVKRSEMPKKFVRTDFSHCLESSIKKAANILILILGIVNFYGLIIALLGIYCPQMHPFFRALLEMTTAIGAIVSSPPNEYRWLIFAIAFGGMSIHTQINSIMEPTDLPYRAFLKGRLISSLLALLLVLFL